MCDGAGTLKDPNDDGPPPPKRPCSYIPITMNGRTLGRTQSYVYQKRERDRIAQELLERAQKVDEQYVAHKKCLHWLAEAEAALVNVTSPDAPDVGTSSLDADEVPPASPNVSNPTNANQHAEFPSSSGKSEVAAESLVPPLPAFPEECSQNDVDGSQLADNDEVEDDSNSEQSENKDKSEEPKKEKDELKVLCREYFTELHGLFVTEGVPLRGQRKFLEFFKNLPDECRQMLPLDGRTLRPPAIRFTRRLMPPGEFTYFGIENMLNYAPKVLFDVQSNFIDLICNMDGLPLSKTPAGKKFWPILGSVDEYPVFVIGAYEGTNVPVCANEYVRDFVTEVKKLTKHGCTVKSRIYKFCLKCLICDSPATCFIIGCKQHGGYFACRRCKTEGESVTLGGVNARGRPRSTIRYPAVGNDPPRLHEEFVEYAQLNENCGHSARLSVAENCSDADQQESENGVNFPAMRYLYDDENAAFCLYVEDEEGNIHPVNDDDEGDDEDLDEDDDEWHGSIPTRGFWNGGRLSLSRGQRGTSRSGRGTGIRTKNSKKTSFHLHPTILTEIPGFDITKCMVLDIMHLVFLGVVKTMLERWVGMSRSDRTKFKLSADSLSIILFRLTKLRLYTPAEFQRKPDKLKHLCSWKATQFRQFLLYIGAVVLLGAVPRAQLNHFHLLVVAMRLMCRKLPDYTSDLRTNVVKGNARHARYLLKKFVSVGNEVYGKNFSSYNVHHLPYTADDYERYEVSLDFLSGFRFENANGHVKRLIKGHVKPLTQLENKISSMVYTKTYARNEKNRVVNSIEEYYEIPELVSPISDDDHDDPANNEVFEVGRSLPANCVRYTRYHEMRLRNFKLRTDNESDRHVMMTGEFGTKYVRLKKILQDDDTNEIYLVGYVFERLRPLFSLAPQLPGCPYTSVTVGIRVCDQLSSRLRTFTLSELDEKCFGFPLNPLEEPITDIREWVLVRYLH